MGYLRAGTLEVAGIGKMAAVGVVNQRRFGLSFDTVDPLCSLAITEKTPNISIRTKQGSQTSLKFSHWAR